MTETKHITITVDEVKKVAHLARLSIDDANIAKYAENFSNILDMIAHINAKDTKNITPMASPFADAELFLRSDNVTESNKRELIQSLAPAIESGLYLVPKVID